MQPLVGTNGIAFSATMGPIGVGWEDTLLYIQPVHPSVSILGIRTVGLDSFVPQQTHGVLFVRWLRRRHEKEPGGWTRGAVSTVRLGQLRRLPHLVLWWYVDMCVREFRLVRQINKIGKGVPTYLLLKRMRNACVRESGSIRGEGPTPCDYILLDLDLA
jgi:hypothetical protein